MVLYNTVKKFNLLQQQYSGLDCDIARKKEIDRCYDDIVKKIDECKSKSDMEETITDFIYVLYMDDGIKLYKKYFSLIHFNPEMIASFKEYLNFWGPDYSEDLDTIDSKIKDNDLGGIIDYIMLLESK